ncbi:MAG: ABC transporter permease subunit [Planctomycetes bacterium]|jgi:ABC-2 type transport system permease protein|nr:ABC transporter permease subunit [Planctomycetota bacterium]MBT4559515.1 ABC transporter permease subunit [Planctomycetota bacterium]MBT5121070.1 ABC transporter permease subunit [Planctomycetota bacterium]MBT7012151.1 ABC transporter permease subunit [Planctomycetota bacterium]MBT7318958.1 ABC transporter permease subunit [Planctomycetota bacterium]
MKAFLLAKREWKSAVDSPVAYVLLALLPAVSAAFFFVMGPFFDRGVATLRDFFGLLPWLFVMVIPAITMRAWAEERRSGTEELLMTYPMRLRDLVLGKFLGAWGLLAASLFFTAGIPLTVASLGDLDWGPVVGGYLGAMLMGAAAISFGLFLSASTRNQVVAWLISAVGLMTWNMLDFAATAEATPPALGRWLLAADFDEHFFAFARGVVDFRDVVFYLSVTVFFLCLNGLTFEHRRAS